MKNAVWLITTILLLTVPVRAEEAALDEGQRQQALLQIWKDHVKTLTRERDQALDELEKLKSQGGVSASAPEAAPVDNTALLEKERQIEELNARLVSLEDEKQKLAAAQTAKDDLIAELQNKLQTATATPVVSAAPVVDSSAQQAELAQLKSQVDVWQKKYQILEDASRLQQARIKDLSKKNPQAVAAPVSKPSAPSQADATLKKENENLKIKLAQLENKQKKDLTDSQAFTEEAERNRNESQSKIKELEQKIQELGQTHSEENAQALKKAEAYDQHSKELEAQITELEKKNSDIQNKLKASEETEQRAGQIQGLLQQVEAERDRLLERNATLEKAALLHEDALQKAENDKKSLQESYATLSEKYEQHKKEDEAQAQSVEAEREKLRALKASLDADQEDLKNFKSNIETYLESLSASFEERRKG